MSWRTDAAGDLVEAGHVVNESPTNDGERFNVALRFALFAVSATVNALLSISDAVDNAEAGAAERWRHS